MKECVENRGLKLHNALICGNDTEVLSILKCPPDISEVPGVSLDRTDILRLLKNPLAYEGTVIKKLRQAYNISTNEAIISAAKQGNDKLFGTLLAFSWNDECSFETLCTVLQVISEHPILKKYINFILSFDDVAISKYSSRLDALLIKNAPLSETELAEIKQLLENGFRPISHLPVNKKYYYDYEGPMQHYLEATNNGNLKLIKLLFEYDIKPNTNEYRKYITSEKGRSSLKDNDAIPFILSTLFPDEISTLKDKIKHIHHQIFEFILSSKKEAVEKGKPLMLLLGEEHFALESTLLEAIVITIAVQYFNITSLMTENTQPNDVLTPSELQLLPSLEEIIDLYTLPDITCDKAISSLCESFGIIPTRLDFGTFAHMMNTPEFNRYYYHTKDGLQMRNREMVKRAIARSFLGDAIFITGACHVQGLIQETDLQSTFYVKALNLIKIPDGYNIYTVTKSEDDAYHFSSLRYLVSSEHAYQANNLLDNWQPCVTPNMILDSVKEVCLQEDHKIRKMLSTSCFSATSLPSSSTDVIPPLQFGSLGPRRGMRLKKLAEDIRYQPETSSRPYSDKRKKRM